MFTRKKMYRKIKVPAVTPPGKEVAKMDYESRSYDLCFFLIIWSLCQLQKYKLFVYNMQTSRLFYFKFDLPIVYLQGIGGYHDHRL